MWATRLHLYGGKEEMALLSAANQLIAGLPISVDDMPAEEQLMLMGIAPPKGGGTGVGTGLVPRGSDGVMPFGDSEEEEDEVQHAPQLYTGNNSTYRVLHCRTLSYAILLYSIICSYPSETYCW